MKKYPKPSIITKAQILHLLTVFVITPLAGFVSAWVAKHFPGMPNFSQGEITAFFVTGAGSALTAGIHYLHGWQLWERTVGRVVDIEDKGTALQGNPVTAPPVIVHVHGDGSVAKEPEAPVEDKPPAPQPVSTPATEQSQAITGM